MFEPIRQPNAIDQVVFGLELNRWLDDDEIQLLRELEGGLATDFPKMNEVRSAGFEFSLEGVNQREDRVSGLEFSSEPRHCEHKISAVRPSWIIHTGSNNLRIHCLDYRTWKGALEKALKYLSAVLVKFGAKDLRATKIVLQFNDVFVYEGDPEAYDVTKLFENGSRYLTSQVFDSGPLWHINQGWFEEIGVRTLNVLNISTRIKDPKEQVHLSIIEHVMTQDIVKPIDDMSADALRPLFSELHTKNKEIVSDLLIKEIKEKIGI